MMAWHTELDGGRPMLCQALTLDWSGVLECWGAAAAVAATDDGTGMTGWYGQWMAN